MDLNIIIIWNLKVSLIGNYYCSCSSSFHNKNHFIRTLKCYIWGFSIEYSLLKVLNVNIFLYVYTELFVFQGDWYSLQMAITTFSHVKNGNQTNVFCSWQYAHNLHFIWFNRQKKLRLTIFYHFCFSINICY